MPGIFFTDSLMSCLMISASASASLKYITTHINKVIQARRGLQATLVLQIGSEHLTESIVIIRIKDVEYLFSLARTKLKGVKTLTLARKVSASSDDRIFAAIFNPVV